MAFLDVFSRQLSLSGAPTGSLRSVFGSFQCRAEDEVFLEGGLTGANVPAFASKFSANGLHGNLLAIADEEGSVRLMDTRKPASKSIVKEIDAHRNAIFDIAWLPGDSQLLTASGDTKVCLWDVVGGVRLDMFAAHTSSVKTVDVKTDEPSVLVSGGRDGNIFIWDTRCSKRDSKHRPVNTISMAHKMAATDKTKKKKGRGQKERTTPASDGKHSVTSVCFYGNNKIASAGTADGVVKIWDLRTNYSKCRKEPPPAWHTFAPVGDTERPYSFTSLVSDPTQSLLFASSTDDIIYMYSTTTLQTIPVRAFGGHRNSSFYVKACTSPDGCYLLSGSSCGNAFIWEIDCCETPPLMLVGHMTEVTAVSWCPTQIDKVVTCSDNNDVRIWRVDQRNSSTQPGECCVGDCQEYTGKGCLKAKEALRTYQEQFDKEKERTRSPLNTITPNSKLMKTPKSTHSPKIFQFVRQSPTTSQGQSSSNESGKRDSKLKSDQTCKTEPPSIEHDVSKIIFTNNSCNGETKQPKEDDNHQRHLETTASCKNRPNVQTVAPTSTSNHSITTSSESLSNNSTDDVIITKVEVTPERCQRNDCESRKRKLLFQPSYTHHGSGSKTPTTSQEQNGGDCPSKKRKTQSTSVQRNRLKERGSQTAPASRNIRNGKRKGNTSKTPRRDANQASVRLYFKPNAN